MNESMRPPISIAIAALVMVGQTMGLLFERLELVSLLAVFVAVLFATLLFRSSRVAWIIVLSGSIAQVVEGATTGQFDWLVLVNVVLLLCLLAPTSVTFIWANDKHARPRPLATVRRKAADMSYGLLATAAGWERMISSEEISPKPRQYGLLIGRAAACTLFLLLLVGAFYQWEQTTGSDSPIVEVLADVIWTVYAVVQVGLIVVLLYAGYRYLSNRNAAYDSSRPDSS